MNLVGFEQLAELIRFVQSGDHDPGGTVPAFELDAMNHLPRIQLTEFGIAVIDDPQRHVLDALLAHVGEIARCLGRRAWVRAVAEPGKEHGIGGKEGAGVEGKTRAGTSSLADDV